MFDHIVIEETSDRELLLHLLKRIQAMALDLSKLTAAIAAVSTDVTALINADASGAAASAAGAAAQLVLDQAAVDALVPTVTAIDTVAQAALAVPAAAPVAAA